MSCTGKTERANNYLKEHGATHPSELVNMKKPSGVYQFCAGGQDVTIKTFRLPDGKFFVESPQDGKIDLMTQDELDSFLDGLRRPAASVFKPAGSDVESKFLLPGGPLWKHSQDVCREAFALVRQVHGFDEKFPAIKVGFMSSTAKKNGELIYAPRTRRPIEMRVAMRDDLHPLTVAHEIGHYIDFMLGIKNKSAKAAVMAAIKQSAAYSAFDVENHPEKVVDVITVDLEWEVRIVPTPLAEARPEPKLLKKYLSDEELFARAYAQYIATRTNTGADYLNKHRVYRAKEIVRGKSLVLKLDYPIQWTDDDFAPIVAEFDRMFLNLGWMVEE